MSILDQKSSYQRHPKPPYSYAGMIVLAIESSPDRRLTLAGIHKSLGEMFHFFRDGNYTGWKDSIRHNLSQNKSFKKILKQPHRPNSKGNYWTVDLAMVSPDVFIRQDTDVARTGNWEHELHQQVGLQPVTLKPELIVRQKEIVFPYPVPFYSSADYARTSSPLMQPKNLNLKRKAISTGCMEGHTAEPTAKRQKKFSFNVASILRLRSHINAKISKVKKSKQSSSSPVVENNRPAEAISNFPDWMQSQTNVSDEPMRFTGQHTSEIPEFSKTTTRSVSSLPLYSVSVPQISNQVTTPQLDNFHRRRDLEFVEKLSHSKWLPSYEDFKHPLQGTSVSRVNETASWNSHKAANWPMNFSPSFCQVNPFSNLTQFPCYEEVLI